LAAEPLVAVLAEQPLDASVRDLCERFAGLWRGMPAELPFLGPPVGVRAHFANARATARLIDEVAVDLRAVPDEEPARQAWRETQRERLQRFGELRLGWPAGYRRLLFADEYFTSSVAFAREARAFDPDLPLDSLWQALRNVWIGNSLQMLLDLPVTLNPSLFAYSMLYPLTDNLLDDPAVSGPAKRRFNQQLGRRLSGFAVPPVGPGESAAFRLLGRIEAEYPRRSFPSLHQSLLAIHGGQVLSLRQQTGSRLGQDELLALCCRKGGCSLLADLHLVAGRPSPSEEAFAFGYGVFLQLLDDLQDVEQDLTAGHQTLFTLAAEQGSLDQPAARLARFIDAVLDDASCFGEPEYADRKDLVRRNCRSLLVGAVADQPRRFSRGFRSVLARQWPLSLRAMRRLRRRAERRFKKASERLQGRSGAPSLLDWLLREFPDASRASAPTGAGCARTSRPASHRRHPQGRCGVAGRGSVGRG
jgi:hypothetical protein